MSLGHAAGTSGSCTLWQRINVMQVMRVLSFEAPLIHYLFCCFDLVEDAKLKVVEEMTNKFSAIIDSAARLASDPGEDDPLHSIASLYQSRANSTHLAPLCQTCPYSIRRCPQPQQSVLST